MYGFSATSIVLVFIACILGFEVAPHLALASRQAGWAIRGAAVLLGLDAALSLPLAGFLFRLPFGEVLISLVPTLCLTGFWVTLAWAAVALLASSPSRSSGGPELR